MMFSENLIRHERGTYWVLEFPKGEFSVFRNGFTFATGDSKYDDLSLAIARCDYLSKTRGEKANV